MKIWPIFSFSLMITPVPCVVQAQNPPEMPDLSSEFEQHKQSLMMEFDQYKQELEAGFKAYKETYNQAFNAYKQVISQHWGEFRDAPPDIWVSYAQSGNVRRTVDYSTGEVQVEMLVDKGTRIGQVKNQLDEAVYRLLNTTEEEAFESDVVANRVERELSNYPNVLQKGSLGKDRLFTMQDMLSLQMNHDGYLKVNSQGKNVAVTDQRAAQKEDKDIIRVTFKVPHSIHERALKFAESVQAAAKKEKIDEELIFAIMETESSFNPMAKSHVPAYGLMQIVPRTAGRDATEYLYGKSKLLAPSYLFKPENNITIGAAYLHVLYYRYMRKIKNHESRMYCAIAAYNTGTSNVGKAFINQASFTKATPVINQLEPDEVYEKLKKQLPQKETRQYIEKVSTRMEKYL
jgi:membrane-bound lytic murein transglycosylase C